MIPRSSAFVLNSIVINSGSWEHQAQSHFLSLGESVDGTTPIFRKLLKPPTTLHNPDPRRLPRTLAPDPALTPTPVDANKGIVIVIEYLYGRLSTLL